MKGFLDTGFLLTILTHRAGAEKAWALLKDCEMPAAISSLQLIFIRHGLNNNLLDPKQSKGVHEVTVRAIKLLDWLFQQEIITAANIDYGEVISLAAAWVGKLRTPMPTLLLVWPAAAVVSGATAFLSFDPRTRALAKAAGLKPLPERL